MRPLQSTFECQIEQTPPLLYVHGVQVDERCSSCVHISIMMTDTLIKNERRPKRRHLESLGLFCLSDGWSRLQHSNSGEWKKRIKPILVFYLRRRHLPCLSRHGSGTCFLDRLITTNTAMIHTRILDERETHHINTSGLCTFAYCPRVLTEAKVSYVCCTTVTASSVEIRQVLCGDKKKCVVSVGVISIYAQGVPWPLVWLLRRTA